MSLSFLKSYLTYEKNYSHTWHKGEKVGWVLKNKELKSSKAVKGNL